MAKTTARKPTAERVETNGAAPAPRVPEDPWAGLPRMSWSDVEALSKEQGVGPVTDVDALAGDFWPEDESSDEFITWLREQRREGRESPP